MKQKERNTCQLSKERIWKRVYLDGYSYRNNSSSDANSIDKAIEFLQKSKVKATEKGLEEVVVTFDYDEGDDNTLSHAYMSISGYRLETDKEYKDRLALEIARMDNEKKSFDMKRAYYDTPPPDDTLTGFEKRRKEFQDKLKEL